MRKKKIFLIGLLISVIARSWAFSPDIHQSPGQMFITRLKQSSAKVILATGTPAASGVSLLRKWNKEICSLAISNNSGKPISIREIILFDFYHGLPGNTGIYGEGFQKLAQVGGTLEAPADLGTYTDRNHYKIPEPENMRTAYGMFTLQLPDDRVLLATTSCNRFISRFSFDGKRIRISLDCENLILQPGETWHLEDFMAISGPDREKLYDQLTTAIATHHPRLKHEPVPMGWCSWYCFGPQVTAKNVADNTAWIASHLPELKYIQIDDGYQPWMGDWMSKGNAFGGDVESVLKEIKQKGLEPAIWVAPFVASPESQLFKNHPDWFVKDEKGSLLRSDKIGFGGWRLGPWYVLDGTHPQVQAFFTELFRSMREQWGCTYFKLDANYWGAMHGGVHYDKKATRIEAYRRGMAAILKGAGDAFVLGCNHPIWASLGLIHGSRSSMDTWRKWESFRDIGRENLLRGWQNGRLWWNDPDCILLTDGGATDIMDQAGNNVNAQKKETGPTENEYLFHATTVYASGGMLLSGDDLTKITPGRLDILKKLMPPTGIAARFENEKFEVGTITLPDQLVFAVFNWGEQAAPRRIKLPKGTYRLVNKWTGQHLGDFKEEYIIPSLPMRSALLIEAHKIADN